MPEDNGAIGVLGASSYVGSCLLTRLQDSYRSVIAFSRKEQDESRPNIHWYRVNNLPDNIQIGTWISAAPIWVLIDLLPYIKRSGAVRIVALSSTSSFTKIHSRDMQEKAIAEKLINAEDDLKDWAESEGIDWCIFRPTLIYGLGRDKNICEIARFIKRYHFFPLVREATGLRQPVHADDVACACISAMNSIAPLCRTLNLSGRGVISYKEMVGHVFVALGYRRRIISCPLILLRIGVALLRLFPRYQYLSVAMFERMREDLVFDHSEAKRVLHFNPRSFELSEEDLPID